MSRLFRFPLFTLVASVVITVNAAAGTYYIAANGSDSANGTSKTSPWAHAPGMNNCAGACASAIPKAGDQFIFRGGDTWHFKAATIPATGGTWTWTWSGSSGSPVYIGVDQSWYSGSSWTRPVLNLDNPTWASSTHQDSGHTGFVTACTYDEYNFLALNFHSVNYVTFDNFEFTGVCWTQPPTYGGASYLSRTGTYIILSNNYFHGWTMVYVIPGSCCMDQGVMVGGSTTAGITNNVLVGNVFDGSDSPPNTGWALYADAYDIHQNVFRYLSNALNSPGNFSTVHDNLFEYISESFDPTTHSSVIEGGGGSASQYFYNNIIRHTTSGTVFWPELAGTGYVFNNVFFDNVPGAPVNCFLTSPNNDIGTRTYYVYNNTFDYECEMRVFGGNGATAPWNGTINFENNHFIGYSPLALSTFYSIDSGAKATIIDSGSEVYQSESAANAQGYTPSNSYAPTSTTGATVGAGSNATPACNDAGNSLCWGTSAGVSLGARSNAVYPAIPIAPRPPSGSWDAGAYKFAPNPPTNLQATVQ